MKVTILTEGGRDIGYGHITRCTSIYEAFEEIGKQSQLVVNGDETIEDLLKGKNYKVFNWLDDQQLLFEILDNANIVFIDSYLAKDPEEYVIFFCREHNKYIRRDGQNE